MPPRGRECIDVPARTLVCDLEEVERVVTSRNVVLVSNANASHLYTLRLARRMRASGAACRTIAILHNYPKNRVRELILKVILKRFDQAIAVEPGLRVLRGDALTPSWLAVPHAKVAISNDPLNQGRIKCYARPDRSKGLHLLPAVFSQMSELGYVCEVALGKSLENDESYIKSLETSLAPWLVKGFRGPEWLNPGDIFVVPSIYGEAACLSAQEAMSKGVFVVASRVGLMPYLSPTNQGIRTFETGSATSAITALKDVAAMSQGEFEEECRAASIQMATRSGRWYREVSARLQREHTEVGKSVS
jgi:glycosyltransferase involved in cell wall biosynthesis